MVFFQEKTDHILTSTCFILAAHFKISGTTDRMSRFLEICESAVGPLHSAFDKVLHTILLEVRTSLQLKDQEDLVGIGACLSIDYHNVSRFESDEAKHWVFSSVPSESTAFKAGIRHGDIVVQALSR